MKFGNLKWLYPALLMLTFFPLIALTGLEAWGDYYDDAFITYRYADNLARGEGLFWNTGEAPTEGFTSLLHIMMLTPLMKLGLGGLEAARLINLVFLIAIAFVLYQISTRSSSLGKASALTAPPDLSPPTIINLARYGGS